MSFAEVCRTAREEGFEGIEVAPFTIFGDFSDTSIGRAIPEANHILKEEGLEFVGFHWLLAKPEGLHLAAPDLFIRSRTWDHLRFMLDCAGAFGGGKLVLGSPRQRSTPAGMKPDQVKGILGEELARLADYAASCNSMILLEALSPDQTDIVTSLEEATAIVKEIDRASIRTMLDFHNARNEKRAPHLLVDEYWPFIAHVHLNETAGGPPGSGDTDYASSLCSLMRHGYGGWLSIEIFEVPENPRQVLRTALDTMKRAEKAADAASMPR